MLKWGLNVDKICVSCQVEDGNHAHLFFKCQYSATVWNQLRLKLKLQLFNRTELKEEVEYLTQSFPLEGLDVDLSHMALTSTVWHLWRERNHRTFKKNSKSHQLLVLDVVRDTQIIINICSKKALNSRFDK